LLNPETCNSFRNLELHETLVALPQTIYWANYSFLMRGAWKLRRATAGRATEKELRQDLPVGEFTSMFLYIEFIFYVTANVSYFLRGPSVDDTCTIHLAHQGRDSVPNVLPVMMSFACSPPLVPAEILFNWLQASNLGPGGSSATGC